MQINNDPVDMIHFHGGPDAGKDTQAKLWAAGDSGAVYIPPGQILRDCVERQDGYRKYFDFDPKKLAVDLGAGKFVDGVVLARGIIRMVRKELENGKRRFLFTGWPREEASLHLLEDLIVDLLANDVEVAARHVYLKAPVEERRERHQANLRRHKVRERKLRVDDTSEGFASRDSVFQTRTFPFLQANWTRLRVIPVKSCATTHQTLEAVQHAIGLPPKSSVEGLPTLPARARR